MARQLQPIYISAALFPVACSLCFSDGIPASQRVNLTNGDGENYGLGMWVPSWAAGVSTSAVMAILINEMLGFNTVTGGGPTTLDGFFAMTGCETPTDSKNRGCGRKKTYYHVHLEGWTIGYLPLWNQIQQDYPETAPRNLGSMGYQGLAGQYLPGAVVDTAYNREGLALEFYRTHNSSWSNPSQYFDNINAFNASENFKTCKQTRLMESQAMEDFLRVTGDSEGVETGPDGKLIGKCFSGYYWFAPTCRADPLQCFPFITAAGYGYQNQMQKSAAFRIPLVIAEAKLWSDYTDLPTKVKTSFYWWQPDPSFLVLDARRVVFDPYDPEATGRGNLLSDTSFVAIEKYASFDLQALAPEVYTLLSNFKIGLGVVNDLMKDEMDSGDSPDTVACRWLQANQDVWESWLPDSTECFPQFGLYDDATKQFVQNRSNRTDLTCRACDSGSYSLRLRDDTGLTHVCVPCRIGTTQPSGASLQCDPCPTGEYQDETGSTNCKRCDQGKYQDTQGATQCKDCPAATTTLGYGSASVFDCGCDSGTINIANESEGNPMCAACGEGLYCPFRSTLQSLTMGQAAPQYQPALQKGFYSTMEEPLEVFKCIDESFCPGGTPELCNGGRVGLSCAECPPGQGSSGTDCSGCNPHTIFLWWFAVAVFLAGCCSAYYLANPPVAAIASAKQSANVSAGLVVAWLQTLAIISSMTVAWPSSINGTFSATRFLLLDVESLSLSCFASRSPLGRYLLKVFVFPTGMAWMSACFLLSKCLPARLRWQQTKTLNAMGQVTQVGFAIMSTVALQSMTCYTHPNGASSLVLYSSVICGEGEQFGMMAAGLVLLSVIFAFLALVTYALVSLPSWSSRMLNRRVQTFNFLTYRFRLDRWWFGLFVLLRGPLMSLVVTCATDSPDVQVCVNALILTIYALIQSTARPWKTPLLNWVDLFTSVLLIQIAVLSGLSVKRSTQAFAGSYSLILVVLLFVWLGALVFIVFTEFLREFCGKKDSILLRAFESRSAGLAKKLLECGTALVNKEELVLQQMLDQLNYHDLSRLQTTIDLLSSELELRASHARGHGNSGRIILKAVADAVPDASNLPAKDPEQAPAPANPDLPSTNGSEQKDSPDPWLTSWEPKKDEDAVPDASNLPAKDPEQDQTPPSPTSDKPPQELVSTEL